MQSAFLLSIIAVLGYVVINRSEITGINTTSVIIPEVETLAFERQEQPRATSHSALGISPHEISISPPPKKKYSSKYLVVFLGRKILGAIQNKEYKYTYYDISLPQDTSKAKEKKGDGLIPIGDYYILKHELVGKTLVMTLNYPNIKDAANALKKKIISKKQYDAIVAANKAGRMPPSDTPLGGPIIIRGDAAPGTQTNGSIGIPPQAMAKIWEFAPRGTPIRIVP